ncbi:MAG: hypothetical protein E7668_03305 [Ruminococcaceae bacterium]|nr:hypothetical protein [Oscillospiraceae bacterium]
MKRTLLSPHTPQYRANLHSHSTLSDGKLTPQELKEVYRSRGYSILAITDHEYPCDHSDLNEPDFLLLTGYEAHLRPNPSFDPYQSEIHMNLFAKDPHNETIICYTPAYGKYMPEQWLAQLRRVGSECPREYSIDYAQKLIDTAVANGYLVSYNHPVWSMEAEETILSYRNIFSIEISNYNSFIDNHLEHSGALYDKMLRMGMRRFCHAGDDCHNKFPITSPRSDSFGAWTMILAEELTYEAVINAMENGDMYASMGPAIYEVSFENDNVFVSCSPAAKIIVYDGSKRPSFEPADEGSLLTEAILPLREEAPYFRVGVVDERGRIATTRGFFRDEWKS